jgi:hypothetical protein
MSRTASYVKDRYNTKTYDRYTFYIRKDEALNDRLQDDKQKQSISRTVKDALSLYYDKQTDADTRRIEKLPKLTTKRQRRAAIKKVIEQLRQIRTAEEISRDNIPTNLQSSPSYEAAEECISALEEVLETLDTAY